MTIATGSRSGKTLKAEALETLSSPALAADLIRQLVERAGLTCREHGVMTGTSGFPYVWVVDRANPLYVSFNMQCAAVTITRLLALPPNAGVAEVLKVLRGDNATINAARAAEVT